MCFICLAVLIPREMRGAPPAGRRTVGGGPWPLGA